MRWLAFYLLLGIDDLLFARSRVGFRNGVRYLKEFSLISGCEVFCHSFAVQIFLCTARTCLFPSLSSRPFFACSHAQRTATNDTDSAVFVLPSRERERERENMCPPITRSLSSFRLCSAFVNRATGPWRANQSVVEKTSRLPDKEANFRR